MTTSLAEVMPSPIAPSGVRQMIWKRSTAAFGPEGRIHPHQLRHTFAHDWLAAGGEEGPGPRRRNSLMSKLPACAADGVAGPIVSRPLLRLALLAVSPFSLSMRIPPALAGDAVAGA